MLTHLDSQNRPAMVDVGDKAVTARFAHACARVRFPAEVGKQLREAGWQGKKGPLFHTAIIAGIQAAKKTSDLIPLCHPLALDDVKVELLPLEGAEADCVEIHCRVRCTGRTGVEMEALTGASVAALTLYDMTKALSHDIVIEAVRLLEKTGGKSDFRKMKN